MASSGIKIEFGPETAVFQQWAAALQGNLQASVQRATKQVALYLVQEITQRIFDKKYAPNAALTIFLKEAGGYGTTPLVRTGRVGGLVRSITRELLDNDMATEVGVLTRKSGKGGRHNIGELLHNGGTIKITAAMRRAFMRRLKAIERATGKQAPPPPGRKAVIRIPPRPFVRDVFQDARVIANVEDIYLRELRKGALGI